MPSLIKPPVPFYSRLLNRVLCVTGLTQLVDWLLTNPAAHRRSAP
jgi:hypothetical protein